MGSLISQSPLFLHIKIQFHTNADGDKEQEGEDEAVVAWWGQQLGGVEDLLGNVALGDASDDSLLPYSLLQYERNI